jgi:aspartate/methionine/tyrosine aminotransferase
MHADIEGKIGWPSGGLEKGRLKFDVADLQELAAETGKFEMLVINFPHNPTGACLTTAEMHEVAAVASQHDAWLFSDEMYRGLGAHRS